MEISPQQPEQPGILDEKDMSKDFSDLVHAQGEILDKIMPGSNVGPETARAEEGKRHLEEMLRYQRKVRIKRFCLLGMVVVVLAVIAIIIVVIVKS